MRYEVAVDAEFELRPRRRGWKIGDPSEPVDVWFHGRRFLWHSGTPETYPIVTAPAMDSGEWHDDQLAVARFLSALSATHMWGLRASARWEGAMVPREEFDRPTWTEHRGPNLFHQVGPELVVPTDDADRLRCLALMREARNSNSEALTFLSCWKVIELCIGRNDTEIAQWIKRQIRDLAEPGARDGEMSTREIRRFDWFAYFKRSRRLRLTPYRSAVRSRLIQTTRASAVSCRSMGQGSTYLRFERFLSGGPNGC